MHAKSLYGRKHPLKKSEFPISSDLILWEARILVSIWEICAFVCELVCVADVLTSLIDHLLVGERNPAFFFLFFCSHLIVTFLHGSCFNLLFPSQPSFSYLFFICCNNSLTNSLQSLICYHWAVCIKIIWEIEGVFFFFCTLQLFSEELQWGVKLSKGI